MRNSFKNKIMKVNIWPIALSLVVSGLLCIAYATVKIEEENVPELPRVEEYHPFRGCRMGPINSVQIFSDEVIKGTASREFGNCLYADNNLKFKVIRKLIESYKSKEVYWLGFAFQLEGYGEERLSLKVNRERPSNLTCVEGNEFKEYIIIYLKMDQDKYHYAMREYSYKDIYKKLFRISMIDPSKVIINLTVSDETSYGDFIQFITKTKYHTQLDDFYLFSEGEATEENERDDVELGYL